MILLLAAALLSAPLQAAQGRLAPAPTTAHAPRAVSALELLRAPAPSAALALPLLAPQPRAPLVPTFAPGGAPAPAPSARLADVRSAWEARGERAWPFERELVRGPASEPGPHAEHSGPYGDHAVSLLRPEQRQPTPEETDRARAEYRRAGEAGEEILDAPTWLDRLIEPGLKAAFGVAKTEDILVDYANAVTAEIPRRAKDEPAGLDDVELLKWRRARDFATWKTAAASREKLRFPPARAAAVKRLLALHQAGLLPPGVEKPYKDGVAEPAERTAVRRPFSLLLAVAIGKLEMTSAEARAEMRSLSDALTRLARAEAPAIKKRAASLAAEADAAIAARTKAAPRDAEKIYKQSLRDAKDPDEPGNLRHLAARAGAMRAGTVIASMNLGKQVRPTCSLHMLRGLLRALRVRKTLPELVKEGRELLGDPYVGSVTAFDDALQLKLFKHYGDVVQVRASIFATMLAKRRNMKVRIEIGDPVYQHSLILEGLYALDGKTWVSLRDSTSDHPTRMTVEDFASVLTDDAALYFERAWPTPK